MNNINKIQTALAGLVGFRQPINPDYAIVDADNQISESGYFVTDNAYAKIEYIKDNQDFLDITDEDFNLHLLQIKHSAIANVCNQVYKDFDFIDRDLMYKNASNKIDLITLPNGFVGYKIGVTSKRNIAFSINRVLLDFDGTGSITLMLWNTAKKQPLFTKVINITSDHQEELLDWTIDNASATYKGDYYIGYNTNGLTVSPYAREYENAGQLTDYVGIDLEKVFVAGHNTTTLFDLKAKEGISEDIGLNFDISIYEDFTDFTINNRRLFARAVQLDCIIYCIQMYMSSLRNNSNNSASNILYEKMMIDLEGVATNRSISVKGLKNQLVSEITQIKEEIEKLRTGVFKSGKIMVRTLQ
jgi:hypothetical protein